MTYRTRQEIFDSAYTGLKSQGFELSADEFGHCLYRAGSRRCAIGWLIDDEAYSSDFEGEKIQSRFVLEAANIDPYNDWDFARALQKVHDDSSGPEEMKKRLQRFAYFYGLSIPKEVTQ